MGFGQFLLGQVKTFDGFLPIVGSMSCRIEEKVEKEFLRPIVVMSNILLVLVPKSLDFLVDIWFSRTSD